MVLAIIVACCVFRLKLSRHRQACSVAFPALLWNPNHVRVWHSLYNCGLPHWVWTIWEPSLYKCGLPHWVWTICEPWFGESQKWTSVMLSPLERLIITLISSRKFILSDRISLHCCRKCVFHKNYMIGLSMVMQESEMKVIAWFDHLRGFHKRTWSAYALVTEWLSHWVIEEWPREPHYVTIATSCHQLSLHVQSGEPNPAGKWRRNRDKGQSDKIFGHPARPPSHEQSPYIMQKKKSIYFVARGGLGTEGW